MDKTRIVIDTNVLISAFGWRGKPRQVFERVIKGQCELILSTKQLAEISRVLTYPKLNLTLDEQTRFLEVLSSAASMVETHHDINVITDDPSDNALLEAAGEHNAIYIISGDQHLLKLKKFQEIKILTPAEFLLLFEPLI